MSLFLVTAQRLYGVGDVAFSRVLPMNNLSRVPYYDRMRRDVKIYEGKGSDKDIISNLNTPDNAGIAPYPDIIANHGVAFPLPPELHSHCNPMGHGAILTYYSVIVYGDVPAMNQNEAFSYLGMPSDLYSRFSGAASQHPSGDEGMPPTLINAEQEYPSEIHFPDGGAKQIPESSFPIVSVKVGVNDIREHTCYYS